MKAGHATNPDDEIAQLMYEMLATGRLSVGGMTRPDLKAEFTRRFPHMCHREPVKRKK